MCGELVSWVLGWGGELGAKLGWCWERGGAV